MVNQSWSWPKLDRDEWVRGSWQACCLMEFDGSRVDGRLVLTNQHLLFLGRSSSDDLLPAIDFDDQIVVQRKRYRLGLNMLIIETSSGQRFAFRTNRVACKQIEARSRMRRLTKRSVVAAP